MLFWIEQIVYYLSLYTSTWRFRTDGKTTKNVVYRSVHHFAIASTTFRPYCYPFVLFSSVYPKSVSSFLRTSFSCVCTRPTVVFPFSNMCASLRNPPFAFESTILGRTHSHSRTNVGYTTHKFIIDKLLRTAMPNWHGAKHAFWKPLIFPKYMPLYLSTFEKIHNSILETWSFSTMCKLHVHGKIVIENGMERNILPSRFHPTMVWRVRNSLGFCKLQTTVCTNVKLQTSNYKRPTLGCMDMHPTVYESSLRTAQSNSCLKPIVPCASSASVMLCYLCKWVQTHIRLSHITNYLGRVAESGYDVVHLTPYARLRCTFCMAH